MSNYASLLGLLVNKHIGDTQHVFPRTIGVWRRKRKEKVAKMSPLSCEACREILSTYLDEYDLVSTESRDGKTSSVSFGGYYDHALFLLGSWFLVFRLAAEVASRLLLILGCRSLATWNLHSFGIPGGI